MSDELPTLYQQSITKTKYSRWQPKLGRRETWGETGTRLMDYFQDHLNRNYSPLSIDEYNELLEAILGLDVSPSMRAMMTAGPALERDHVAAYNCAFIALNRIQAFPEALYILCCGTGVGFSVERQHIGKLPVVPSGLRESENFKIVVPDSKEGWAEAFGNLLRLLWLGVIPQIDYSQIRPAGMPLKTFGGRASGPGPLRDLFEYAIQAFKGAQGRKLTSAEVHGVATKIGDIVVVGGVRRSALISLFDQDDDEMLNLKSGEWWRENPHYALANNSVAWKETPSDGEFWDKWEALVRSKSGEPGIFNRQAAKRKVESIGRDWHHEFGTNPCGEIILRDRQFCNLTEVTVRSGDDLLSLKRKVRLATILGVIQSTFTDFRFLSKEWKENCEEERLLGVSFTGIMDNALMAGRRGRQELRETLAALRAYAREVADEWADRFGINPPAAIGCGKPSGNNSQRLDTSSGIHERFAKPRYVRRTRMNKTDPVAQLLAFMGVPHEDEIYHPDTTWVFSWAIEAPEEAVVGLSAVDMCMIVDDYNRHWCDHNQSVTINVKEEEWELVGLWVEQHFSNIVGMTFLPASDHIYQQAPYEVVGDEEWQAIVNETPASIDWDALSSFEFDDRTEGAKELACVSGACDIA